MRAFELIGGCLAAIAAGYCGLALYAVTAWNSKRKHAPRSAGHLAANIEPVSVLKPLCGDEPGLYENLRSFCVQQHPCFELICGVRDPNDPAIAVVQRLQTEFPQLDLALVIDRRAHGSNLKVSNLINLLPRARHDWLVLADSDIRVEPDYLRRVTEPLGEPGVGLVTCLYRGRSRAGVWSRLGTWFIDDWFAPSVHVSRVLGSTKFAFGATIALRREVLEAAGGFGTLADFLADDFWLGEFVRAQNLQTVLSDVVVTTDVTERTLTQLWAHELRWMRTIRAAEPLGFAFSFITFTFPVLIVGWSLMPVRALPVLVFGMVARSMLAWRQRAGGAAAAVSAVLLAPLRDCLSLAEWAVAQSGYSVRWRTQILDASFDRRQRSVPRTAGAAAFGRRGLIVTADDFGLHPAVNEAVELAHQEGALTAASLMVASPAAADAVARARKLPRLRVGLHLVLTDGAAALPRSRIPGLVDERGLFGSRMVWDAIRFFFHPGLRRQLEAEVRAQFEAYAATGLPLDHVNAHKHFHLHPTILSLILRIGRQYGLQAVRLPAEAGAPLLLRPWLRLVAWRLDAAGIAHNDSIVGLRSTGAMDEAALMQALAQLPDGVTEIYFHPATTSGAAIAPTMAGYRHADELEALRSPRVRAAVAQLGVRLGGYADMLTGEKVAA